MGLDPDAGLLSRGAMGREVSFHGNDMSDDFGSDSRHGQQTQCLIGSKPFFWAQL